MSSFTSYKLFPDKWFKKMSKEELKDARDQLRSYSMSRELDTGLKEVGYILF